MLLDFPLNVGCSVVVSKSWIVTVGVFASTVNPSSLTIFSFPAVSVTFAWAVYEPFANSSGTSIEYVLSSVISASNVCISLPSLSLIVISTFSTSSSTVPLIVGVLSSVSTTSSIVASTTVSMLKSSLALTSTSFASSVAVILAV